MATLSSEQLTQLALDYQKSGKELSQFQANNYDTLTLDQYHNLGTKIDAIFHNSTIIFALSTINTANDISSSVVKLKDAVSDMKKALQNIKNVQTGIDIATKVVSLGVDIITTNGTGIANDISSIVDNVQQLSQ